MINKKEILDFLENYSLQKLITPFWQSIDEQTKSANFKKFSEIINSLPAIQTSNTDFTSDTVKIGNANEIELKTKEQIEHGLKKLMPWRKGPFEIFGIFIDAEWRSNLKWRRLENEITPLNGRKILDIGCGNGYYIYRMLANNPDVVIGVEPYLLNFTQFLATSKFTNSYPVKILPLGIELLPNNIHYFDTVFSMGVFYHRRSPFDHLFKLRELAKSGGEIILETLVIEGKKGEVLVPEDRYAKMRNVWVIPTVLTLESWLKRAKFKNIRLINVTKTSTNEQRRTAWAEFESLEDFLDKKNPFLTIEGYPAPRRAIFIAEAP